ncbi:hypothetical protein ANN_09734 [Periplaneta americana]|uniref:Uncharacterized protein n=1 Tax=Periplaneta americana TaxID=6978 RepID=A0ABQ8TNL6_PERAM|nr:hypothetical protein ANN_09734 [Periplaneta americana]
MSGLCVGGSEPAGSLKVICFVKDAVHQRGRADTLEELRQRITNSAALVTPENEMLQNNWWEVQCRLDVYRATQGAHIEHSPKLGEFLHQVM